MDAMQKKEADIAPKGTIIVRILLTVMFFLVMLKYEIEIYLKSVFFYAWQMGHEMALNLLEDQDMSAFEISSTGNFITIFASYATMIYGSLLVAVFISNLIPLREDKSKDIA